MGEVEEQPRFEQQGEARLAIRQPVGAQRFRDAAAAALLAPCIVDVDRMATAKQPERAISGAQRPSSRDVRHFRRNLAAARH